MCVCVRVCVCGLYQVFRSVLINNWLYLFYWVFMVAQNDNISGIECSCGFTGVDVNCLTSFDGVAAL